MTHRLSILLVMLSVTLGNGEVVVLFTGSGGMQSGVHGKGNVYAPDVHFHQGKYWIWFGGQGRDGHDRIQLAQSDNGDSWEQRGVVLENGDANHVNDPSVVWIKGQWWMYYTVAKKDVIDEIALATSTDGLHWKKRQTVLKPSVPPAWDSLLVGRPSVLYENGLFKMWYDGCKELPLGAPAQNVPKSDHAQKFVGYAESLDGLHWERKTSSPIWDGATAVHVSHFYQTYVMVYESGAGTQFGVSKDGLVWKRGGLLVEKSSDFDKFGQVTPFLFFGKNQNPTLYFGAAREKTWDVNCVAMTRLNETMLQHIQSVTKEISQ